MEGEYITREIRDAEIGQPRNLVTGFLQDNPLTRALIEAEVLKKEGGFNFVIIHNRPCVQFKISISADIYVWPEVQKGRAILARAASEARKIERTLMALEMAEPDGETHFCSRQGSATKSAS